jgi:hypothetical protein
MGEWKAQRLRPREFLLYRPGDPLNRLTVEASFGRDGRLDWVSVPEGLRRIWSAVGGPTRAETMAAIECITAEVSA